MTTLQTSSLQIFSAFCCRLLLVGEHVAGKCLRVFPRGGQDALFFCWRRSTCIRRYMVHVGRLSFHFVGAGDRFGAGSLFISSAQAGASWWYKEVIFSIQFCSDDVVFIVGRFYQIVGGNVGKGEIVFFFLSKNSENEHE